MKRIFVTVLFFCSVQGSLIAQPLVDSEIPWMRLSQEFNNGDAWELQLALTQDELYVPIGLVKPDGDGPFPIILIGSGQGVRGIQKIQNQMERSHGLMMRLAARGYASAFINFRNEVPELYNQVEGSSLIFDNVSGGNRTLRSRASLDSDDFISIIEHVRKLPYIDAEAVGAIGSSHSGEIIMKAVSDSNLLTAAVPSEAAVREYLLVSDADAPRDESGTELQLQDVDYVRSISDRERAMQRISRIETPLLVMGRDTDHLQGVFQLLFEWTQESEKDVRWLSYDHHEHGYALLRNFADGSFEPDAIQEQAYAEYVAFFDQHLQR
jgi:dienelactone hydrolase